MCNNLNEKLPEVYQQWALADMPDEVLDRIEKNNVPGWQIVHRVHQAREHARLYMLSPLAPAMVDDLGWNAIRNPDEISHLIEQYKSALLIHHADRIDFQGESEQAN